MEELKTLGTEKALIIDELYKCADELNDVDDLAWYCYKGPNGCVFVGSY